MGLGTVRIGAKPIDIVSHLVYPNYPINNSIFREKSNPINKLEALFGDTDINKFLGT